MPFPHRRVEKKGGLDIVPLRMSLIVSTLCPIEEEEAMVATAAMINVFNLHTVAASWRREEVGEGGLTGRTEWTIELQE